MTLTRKVAYNTAIQAVGKVLYLACSLAIVILITRYLGVAGYGNYNTVIAYLGFFTVLADLGLWMVMVREISQKPGQKEKIVGNVFGLRIITAVTALVLANAVSLFLNYPTEVKIGILIFSIGIFFMLLNQVLLGVFQIWLRADKAAIAEVAGRVLTLILVIWLIRRQADFYDVVAAASAGFLINFFLNFIFANKYLKIIPQFSWPLWKKILRAAIPLAIIGILTTIYYKIDTVLLSLLPLGKVIIPQLSHYSNSEAVGIYGVSYRVLDIVLVLPTLFVGLVYPIISQNISSNFKKTQAAFQRSFDFLVIAGVIFTAVTFFLAPQIIDVIGGSEFGQSIVILQILSIAFLPFFAGNLTGIVMTAAHKQKYLILPYLIFAILNIAANAIFIPYYSFLAAAIVTTCGHFVVCFIPYYLVWRHTKLIPSLKIVPKVLAAGAAIGGLIYLAQKSNLIFNWPSFASFPLGQEIVIVLSLILLSGLLYFLILYLVGGITKGDFVALVKK